VGFQAAVLLRDQHVEVAAAAQLVPKGVDRAPLRLGLARHRGQARLQRPGRRDDLLRGQRLELGRRQEVVRTRRMTDDGLRASGAVVSSSLLLGRRSWLSVLRQSRRAATTLKPIIFESPRIGAAQLELTEQSGANGLCGQPNLFALKPGMRASSSCEGERAAT